MASEGSEEGAAAEEAPPKKKGGLMIVVIVLSVAGVAGGALTVAGPALGLTSPAPAAAEAKAEPPPEKVEAPPGSVVSMLPIVVDLKGQDGRRHHLKVGINAELPKGIEDDQFHQFAPRAREAAIGYLRKLSYEEATDPEQFEKIRDEVRKLIREAVGAKIAQRVVVTDYVAQ